jgi:hypothetical protein
MGEVVYAPNGEVPPPNLRQPCWARLAWLSQTYSKAAADFLIIVSHLCPIVLGLLVASAYVLWTCPGPSQAASACCGPPRLAGSGIGGQGGLCCGGHQGITTTCFRRGSCQSLTTRPSSLVRRMGRHVAGAHPLPRADGQRPLLRAVLVSRLCSPLGRFLPRAERRKHRHRMFSCKCPLPTAPQHNVWSLAV